MSVQKEGSEAEHVSLQKRSKEAIGLLKKAGVPQDLDWVDADSTRAYDSMGDPSTTAQVHPYQFTNSMATLAEEAGLKIIYGSVKSVNKTGSGSAVESVTYSPKDGHSGQEKTISADIIVVTAGPWTRGIIPDAPISALRAHSVTIRPSRPVSAYALFTSITLPSKGSRFSKNTVAPEIYARPNNEVYACGEGDHLVALPPTSAEVAVDEGRCEDIVEHVGSISEELRNGEVTARQACYLPTVDGDGGPLIGETGVKGLLIAAGHSCWGIQNAPATGKLMSEMIWEGKATSANIKSLDPRHRM